MKIRLSSWYWGEYELLGSPYCEKNGWRVGAKAHGYIFEEYNEDKHGWHNSEEFKSSTCICKRCFECTGSVL